MWPGFDNDFFSSNRKRLLELSGAEFIILTSNGLLQRNSDVTYPFRQDSSFWYLTGISEPNLLLVMDEASEYLVLPDREEVIQQFDGEYDISNISRISGISEVIFAQEGWRRLSGQLKRSSKVATLTAPSSYVERHGIYTNPSRSRLQEQLIATNSTLELFDIRQYLVRMRSIKQPEEISAIQRAIDITSDAITQLRQARKNYHYEYEIEAEITAMFKRQDVDHAFAPIVASGASACTIHHVANNRPVDTNGLLVLDIGAEVSNYAADITRTFAINKPTDRQRQIFDAVRDVQTFAIGELKVGVFLKEYEKRVEHFMGERLRELGLIKRIESSEIRKFYPHAASHFLGLDTHDVGEYDKPLEPDMIVTCEPGIYIPDEGIGVRIEDDILITKDGNKNLSEKLSVEL